MTLTAGEKMRGRSLQSGLVRLSYALGAFCGLIGLTIFSGWLLDITFLTVAPGAVTMKTNTALASLLCGVAIMLLSPATPFPSRQIAGRLCAFLVLLLGSLTLSEHIFGWDPGVDQIFAREAVGALATTSPNRMGPPASLCFTLLGLGLFLLSSTGDEIRRRSLQQYPALAALIIALLPIVGYCYSVGELYGIARFTGIAWTTALVLLASSVAILFARPNEGVMALVTGKNPGGLVIRRLLLPMFTLPLALGLIPLMTVRIGFAGVEMGVAIQTVTAMVLFSALVYYGGKRLCSAASEIEQQRELYEGKFAAAFASNPAAIVLTRLRDGIFFGCQRNLDEADGL